MATSLSYDLIYQAPLAQVGEMLDDPAFRERVSDVQGAIRKTVSMESDASGMTVVVDAVQNARGLPGFARKFVGDEINLVQTEHWTDAESATTHLVVPGKPLTMKGTIQLTESGETTTQSVRMEIKAGIPIIAGKIESLVVDMLTSALRRENEVGRAYLAG